MADGGRDVFFVYRGGRAPRNVTHVRIDKSVEVIEDLAFEYCEHLVHVDTHDGIRKFGQWTFNECKSLRSIDLRSVVEIGMQAFYVCENLTGVKFGDKLETIGKWAFYECTSLERLTKLPSIITVKAEAFRSCKALSSIEFSERLETIERWAFLNSRIQRIAIPLKRDLFPFDPEWQEYNQFHCCNLLTAVDLVGGAHTKTVSSLHMESWRTDMKEEINRINQVLPNTPADEKTAAIKQWMDSVIDKMDHYKAEHHRYVKEAITLLELALWKAKHDEKDENSAERRMKKVKLDAESVMKEKRITCGADIVIRNVLPFLKFE